MPANKHHERIVRIIKFWLSIYLCMGLIFYFSSLPAKDMPLIFAYQDIVCHLVMYGLLAYFFTRALKNTYGGLTLSKTLYFTVIFGVIYGLTDEFHQVFVPGRDMSVFDLLIDGVGSFTGSLIYPVRKMISNKGKIF